MWWLLAFPEIETILQFLPDPCVKDAGKITASFQRLISLLVSTHSTTIELVD